MTNPRQPDDPIRMAIEAFDQPEPLTACRRLLRAHYPQKTDLEIEVGVGVARVIYICGVSSMCQGLSGRESDDMARELARRLDDLYLLQLPALEAD